MTRGHTTEPDLVSLVLPLGPRTSTHSFLCNKHDCFTPLVSLRSCIIDAMWIPRHFLLPSSWLLHSPGLGLHLTFSTHGCIGADHHFERSPFANHHDHVRQSSMGGFASRLRGAAWSSDPYYASYERALERIEGESNALEVRTNTKRWRTEPRQTS